MESATHLCLHLRHTCAAHDEESVMEDLSKVEARLGSSLHVSLVHCNVPSLYYYHCVILLGYLLKTPVIRN